MLHPARPVRGLEISPEKVAWAQATHGHTNKEAAKACKVDVRTFQRWKAGHQVPKAIAARQQLLSYIYGAIRIEERRSKGGN